MAELSPYIADLHVHSSYSRATSKAGNLQGLAAWAQIKGIQLVGSGDFTHPGWLAELEENLEAAEPGFYRLRAGVDPDFSSFPCGPISPAPLQPRFILSAEISCIYKRAGKVRKVHNLVFVPDFGSARRLNSGLAAIGNLEGDGRPILGLDSRDLLEMVLEKTENGFLVPAHIWTPWYSLFGSRSGFDHLEECYGDLSEHIFALETGLSSDPDMNRLVSELDSYTLISNSDCHSPSKLGREANIFQSDFSFAAMRQAMERGRAAGTKQALLATIEFFPEEGKYHLDGHRDCGVCLRPDETLARGGCCPVCGKKVTVGVLHRVMELADRKKPLHHEHAPHVYSLTPLTEVLSELLQVGSASKKVMRCYGALVSNFGSEFRLLLHTEREEIEGVSPLLAEAIIRLRNGRVRRESGFDGSFGQIRLFTEKERREMGGCERDLLSLPKG